MREGTSRKLLFFERATFEKTVIEDTAVKRGVFEINPVELTAKELAFGKGN